MANVPAETVAPGIAGVSGRMVQAMAEAVARYRGVDSYLTVARRALRARTADFTEETLTYICKHPQFLALVDACTEVMLYRDGKPAAVGLLIDVVKDTKAPMQHRVRAADLILSRTMAPAAAEDRSADKDLNEMAPAELRALVDSMQDELARRAEPVTAPDSAPKQIDGQVLPARSMFD